jgi:Icc-related predicted phosphoesterase
MLVAAIYDIHANLPALDAVLEEIDRLGVDRVIVGGDVLPEPMPCETLSRLLTLDVPVQFIYGNGEAAVLEQIVGKIPAVPESYRPIIRWTAEQVSPEQQQLISWPETLRTEIPGVGAVLFYHATPRNENECSEWNLR